MKIIAIREDESKRVIEQSGNYSLQERLNIVSYAWYMLKDTREEWLAAKWIVDNDMKVAADYPTIEQIRESQK